MPVWKRYVDDTFTFVKKGCISEVINEINSFHPNIKFTHEMEKDKAIAFLDVLLKRQEDRCIETSVYRKPRNNNIYIHWNAYGPQQWKTGTLSGILRRAYEICSTEENLATELKFIHDVFTRINGYPKYVVDSIFKKFENKHRAASPTPPPSESSPGNPPDDEQKEGPTLILKVPFRGEKGQALLKSLNNTLKKTVPKTEYRIVHSGSKVSNYFSVKDKTDPKHRSGFIYKHDCQNKKCDEDYIGETARRAEIRLTDEHGGKDKNSSFSTRKRQSTLGPKKRTSKF